jgi:toxin CcdB
MAQFDVYRNIGRQREVIPFVVAVQSSLYGDYSRRVVIPLVKASVLGGIANRRLNPTFKIKNIAVVLHPLEIVSVPFSSLGVSVDSLKAVAECVIGSLDDLLTSKA